MIPPLLTELEEHENELEKRLGGWMEGGKKGSLNTVNSSKQYKYCNVYYSTVHKSAMQFSIVYYSIIVYSIFAGLRPAQSWGLVRFYADSRGRSLLAWAYLIKFRPILG